MRKPTSIVLLCTFYFLSFHVFGQKPQIKFGDIKPEDFVPTAYSVDSSASAVVLFDVGLSKFEGNNQGGMSINFKRHRRIRLLNRNSFDLASITIHLFAAGSTEEKIESLEATTYNLEDGKVVAYKLDKNSIFKDRLNKNFTTRKFTLPNIKEGSIIEIKYNFISPYFRDLRTWDFQGSYPVLWSQYDVSIPSFYEFAFIKQGFQPYKIDTGKYSRDSYRILEGGNSSFERTQTYSFTSDVVEHTWAMENVPALKEERYTTTIDNYISKIDFQLSKIRYPDTPVRDIMNNWYVLSEDLLKDEDFGESLYKGNGWLRDEVKKITAGASDKLASAKKIYEYIRDNFSCTDNTAKYLSNPLKKVFQVKNGNVADINLLLTASLTEAGLEAHPVLLSTRDNGKASEIYPLIDKFNYVITQLKLDDHTYLLDASHNKLGFNCLSSDCYNGYARIIDKNMPALIDLSADSIKESKFTNVFIINDEKGGLSGSYTTNFGKYESDDMREKLAKTTKEDYFKQVKKGYSFDIDISNETIDSLKLYEEPVAVKYDFKFKADDDIIYLNPIFGEAYKENPFTAQDRLYPVEMPYATYENYILMMDIPKGYKIDELPKSSKVSLNDGEGMFEFLVAKDDQHIQLRSTIKINKANFESEDYQGLRDFFAYIVKKHSEQIVLKKI